MKIAFDVKGTIEGPKKDLVLRLFLGLQSSGHECIVWSNLYSFAVDAIKNNNLTNTEAHLKFSRSEAFDNEEDLFDLAIEDDRSQTYLAAKKFLFVDDLHEALVNKILENGVKWYL